MFDQEELKQETARRLLYNQLARRQLSHAYLFMGAGEAAHRAALAFAGAINCPLRIDACACATCTVTSRDQHPDLRVISAESSTIKLQQVKDAIALAALTPNQGRYRVFVIQSAERLTREAANALLLTLEEPSPAAVFILTASGPVMPTIQSRCQVIQFHQLGARSPAGDPARDRMLSLASRIMQTPTAERTSLAEEILQLEDGLSLFLATLLDVLRDLLVLAAGGSAALFDRAAAERMRPLFPADTLDLAARCRLVIDAERMFSANVSRRLLCEHLLFSL